MAKNWQKVSGNTGGDAWKPEKDGDSVEGIYRGYKDVDTLNGKSRIYELLQPDMTTISVWGKTALDRDMSYVQVGSEIKIVYRGLVKNPKTGRSFKAFEIYVNPQEIPEKQEDPQYDSNKVADDVPF